MTRMQELFRLLPNRIVEISTAEKVKYHAAASIASNQVVGLIFMAVELMKEAGISEMSAYELLKPLVENNVRSIFETAERQEHASCTGEESEYRGCAQALTGPIERNDTETVRKHLEHMDRPQWETAYRAMGTVVTELAQKKHPKRSYETMKKILGHE